MNTIDILFNKAIEGDNVNEFEEALSNGLNFNMERIENYIHECINKNSLNLLQKILEAEKLVHYVKPAVTKVKTIKMAIVDKSDENLTILLLKALFDLNLEFEMSTFRNVIEKVLDYIQKQGFVKALNYMFERYPQIKENYKVVLQDIIDETEKNSKKMLKLEPLIDKYKKSEFSIKQEEDIKKIIKEDEEFKRKQKERGITLKDETKLFKDWANDKKGWDNYRSNAKQQINGGGKINEDIARIVRLSEKDYSQVAIKDATKTLFTTLDEKLEEMGFKQTSTESQVINDIVKYKNDGVDPSDTRVSEKLKELGELIKENKKKI